MSVRKKKKNRCDCGHPWSSHTSEGCQHRDDATEICLCDKQPPWAVIVRYEGKGRAARADWHLHDLVAIFPEELGEVGKPHTMGCYSPSGGHTSCSSNYAGSKTKPATPEQVKAMLEELRRIGYNNLHVVSRPSVHHYNERRRQAYDRI